MGSIEMLKIRIKLAKGSIKGSNQRIRTILKRGKKNGLDSASKNQIKSLRNFKKVSKSILKKTRTELRKLRRK